MSEARRIVVIGGGTGVFTALTGLKRTPHHLTAVVTMADDGGSTGQLRETFGMLPPGDVRRALVALAEHERTLADLFTYRFEEGEGLAGHTIGNLLLTALERMTGSFEGAVDAAAQLLRIRGEVLPVTLDNIRLKAVLEDGTEILGEHHIDVPSGERARIARIELVPAPRPNPRVLQAIADADAIVIGPGDLYTSLLPNFAVPGVTDAIAASSATVALVVNVMTKFGETDQYTARDFVDAVERMLGTGILDAVMVNTAPPPPEAEAFYAGVRKATEPVRFTSEMFSDHAATLIAQDLIRSDEQLIRHDPDKLAMAITSLLK